ncbi:MULTISPECIES: hypothetical protein [Sphingopyxis]|uniref:hypothetical protein n=1 Tax=Sphingopyxis TaxID=165697 RepID=UPI0015CB6328|nr:MULTISPECIES: hypothetical protein [Sphingopyxis]NYF31010.1 hypothetical protein [Sphingopyxis sp. JAI108]
MSLFITLALLAAAPAAGEDPDSIIVTGIPDAKREERKRAAEFVRRAGVAQLEPVARWIAPVCPRTLGVAAKIAGIVDDRIREVATAAGAPVAPTPCTPNIAVIFTDNGDGLTRAILDKSPRLAAALSSTERERLVQGDGPIRWWYGTRDESRDGMPTTDGILKQYNSSIVSTQVVRALRSATVIVDAEQADGTLLDAVASYTAMVALAELNSDPPPPKDSIMGLFGDEPEHRSLSGKDMALLRGIYSLPPDREAYQHRRRLVGAVRKGEE